MTSLGPFDELDPYAAPKAELVPGDVGEWKTQGIDLAAENPFLTIWTRPRATIRGILDTKPNYLVIPLAMLGGVIQTLNNASQRNTGDQLPLAAILGVALIAGPIGGLIGLYIGGALMALAGRLIGGKGTSAELRLALAWSQVPVLATIPIWILQLALIGHQMFTSEAPILEERPALAVLLMVMGVIELILGIWAFVVALKCVGEAHRFSAWKALGSVFLLFLLIALPLVLLVVLLSSLSG